MQQEQTLCVACLACVCAPPYGLRAYTLNGPRTYTNLSQLLEGIDRGTIEPGSVRTMNDDRVDLYAVSVVSGDALCAPHAARAYLDKQKGRLGR